MLLLLLTTVGLATAGQSSTPASAPTTRQPAQSNHYSLLHNLIEHLGYSDTCVANALETCNPIAEQHQQPSLIQEAKEALQEAKELLKEGKEVLQEGKEASQEGKQVLQEGKQVLQEGKEASQEGKEASQEAKEASQEAKEVLQEAKELLKEVSVMINNLVPRPRHCQDLLDSGDTGSGLRLVYPYPGRPHRNVTVFCDHTVDGGGWTVFQRRSNDSIRQNFERSTWIEYKEGFGDLENEFWLGLDLLHVLTSTTEQELRIDLADYEGGERWAKYGFFNVGSDETKYRLSVGRYTGDAGDAMTYHNGASFSTHDQDNDTKGGNCAEEYRGAWWYKDCHQANLNGYQHQGTHTSNADGINWKQWRGHKYSLRRTSIMIRPAF